MPKPKKSIDERFEAYHRANPELFRDMVALAREAVGLGAKALGVKALVEALRWDTSRKTGKWSDGYKISNDFASRYSRLIMDEHPEFKGMFELRDLPSRGKPTEADLDELHHHNDFGGDDERFDFDDNEWGRL